MFKTKKTKNKKEKTLPMRTSLGVWGDANNQRVSKRSRYPMMHRFGVPVMIIVIMNQWEVYSLICVPVIVILGIEQMRQSVYIWGKFRLYS